MESGQRFARELAEGTPAAVRASARAVKIEAGTDEFFVSGFEPSVNGTRSRAVSAEELYGVQQQADFFVSLGQHDQAIKVLRDHIHDHVETSALIYLDLMKIYQTQGQRDEYEAVRQSFNRMFNAHAPAFDEPTHSTRSLEDDPKM